MKALYDNLSEKCARSTTKMYSTSFSKAVRMLAPSIRNHIHNIYGFVRLADEIVDSFHEYDKEYLLDKLEFDLERAMEFRISINPILNAFVQTVETYSIGYDLIKAFLDSMRADLHKSTYNTMEEYEQYIYGSADVVGLMCLRVFVNGDDEEYDRLKEPAQRLGSAFQKVNFLRDVKTDFLDLGRVYFPGVDIMNLTKAEKERIIKEIEDDFKAAYEGIVQLPLEARFGVYTAYVYYKRLLHKLKKTPSREILQTRIRVSDPMKYGLFVQSWFNYKLNLL